MPQPAHAHATVDLGAVLDGHYRLDELLGEGGVGRVFRAHNTRVGRDVAIKVLRSEHAADREIVDRFLLEARAANRVRHPNVIEIYDVGITPEGIPYIVQELLVGRTFHEFVSEWHGQLSIESCLRRMIPVCHALANAHSVGVVHRDLKPENIFLSTNRGGEVAKVLDFGISKMTIDASHVERLTVSDRTFGTPEYMSPEHIQAFGDLDARADVWALGVIIYESIAGRLPFHSTSRTAMMVEICSGATLPFDQAIPNSPPALAAILDRCLAKSRDERFPDAGALAMELAAFADENGIEYPVTEERMSLRVPGGARATPTGDGLRATPSGVVVTGGKVRITPAPILRQTEDPMRPSDSAPRVGARPSESTSPSIASVTGEQGAPRRRARLWLAIGTLLVFAAAAGSWWAAKRGAHNESSASHVASPASITLTLDCAVPDATAVIRDRSYPLPASLDLERSAEQEVITIQAPGYVRRDVPVVLDRSMRLTAALRLEEAPAIAVPAAAQAADEVDPVILGSGAPVAVVDARRRGRRISSGTEPVAAPAVPARPVVAAIVPAAPVASVAATPVRPVLAPPTAPVPVARPIAADIMRSVIRAHRTELVSCADRARTENPLMGGRIMLRFSVAPTGAVREAHSTGGHDVGSIHRCLEAAVATWRFPASQATDDAQVEYPINLD